MLNCSTTDMACSDMPKILFIILQDLHRNSQVHGHTVTFDLDDTAITELVVRAAMGKICTHESTSDRVYLEFDNALDVINVRKPQCEYQKTLYGAMLLIAVISLLYIIISARVSASQKQETNSSDTFNTRAPYQPIINQVEFGPVRMRSLRS